MKKVIWSVIGCIITLKAHAQCTPPASKKIFVSITGTNPYTLTAHLNGFTPLSKNWGERVVGTPLFVPLSGGADSIYNTAYITHTKYLSLMINCSLGYYEHSCIIKLPPDPCDTPKISLSKTPICSSDTVILTSSISGSCNLYQWQDSITGNIAGETAPTLKITPPVSTAKTYRVKITCPYGTTYSSWLKVSPITTCDTPVAFISKAIACPGDTVLARATGFSPCATIQWEDSLSGAIPGATNDSLTIIASTTRHNYRLKSICPLGKTTYSDWVSYTPYSCDTPVTTISATAGCSGDTLVLSATGIATCTKLEWEDSLSASVISTDSSTYIVAPAIHNSYRLKTICASGSILYSDWMPFTPYTTCDDSVWAGDVNYDLTADYLDLLFLGVAYGSTGYARASSTISWVPQYAKNWPLFYPSAVNYKHADCDGNGIVNDDDTLAIYANYGSVHSSGIIVPEFDAIDGVPDLYFDISGLAPRAGDNITVPIKFGNAGIPVPVIYGLAIEVYINGIPTLTDPLILDYGSSWIGTPDQILRMTYSPGSNQIHGSYVRKDGNDTVGYGTVGLLKLQVPVTTPDKSVMRFNFLSAKVIDRSGNELHAYNIINKSIIISSPTAIIEKSDMPAPDYRVFPNPSSGSITIIRSNDPIGNCSVRMFDMLGRVVQAQDLHFKDHESILKADMPGGSYILQIKDTEGVIWHEHIVIK